jgi:hypothetical protein
VLDGIIVDDSIHDPGRDLRIGRRASWRPVGGELHERWFSAVIAGLVNARHRLNEIAEWPHAMLAPLTADSTPGWARTPRSRQDGCQVLSTRGWAGFRRSSGRASHTCHRTGPIYTSSSSTANPSGSCNRKARPSGTSTPKHRTRQSWARGHGLVIVSAVGQHLGIPQERELFENDLRSAFHQGARPAPGRLVTWRPSGASPVRRLTTRILGVSHWSRFLSAAIRTDA